MYGGRSAGILRYAQDDSEEEDATTEAASTKHASTNEAGTETQGRRHQRNGEDEQHGDSGKRGGAGGGQR